MKSAAIASGLGCAALAFTLFGSGPQAATAAPPTAETCRTRDNNTVAKLLECIQAGNLWQHLSEFQKIADQNPSNDGHPNRNIGTPGYKASADHVAAMMRRAGYRVTIQPYHWKRFEVLGAPAFATPARTFTLSQDWFVARLSPGGSVTAIVQPVGRSVGEDDGNTGCAREDFAGFVPGRIALVRRGSCAVDTQVDNAVAARASAIVIYNKAANSDSGRRERSDGGAYQALLDHPAAIPVVGVVSNAMGQELLQQSRNGKLATASLALHTRIKSDLDYNVIADSPFGDPNHVIVVEGHLDAIYGAGMLDNASGSTTILEIALNMARTHTRNQLRYIWFGGEEVGLLGSKYYTQTLSHRDLKRIVFDIDADVTATPNFAILIADPAHAHAVKTFPPNVVPQSRVGNKLFADYFRTIGIASRNAVFGNDGTDSLAFSRVGVPNSGILTQQDCCKRSWEVKIWGGFRGNYEGNIPSHDGGCVDNPGRWCDNLSNNDRFVFEFVSKGVAYTTYKLANDDSLGAPTHRN
ncbi:MAG TPA: M28 family peptidase [Rhizomicrobium sp.]